MSSPLSRMRSSIVIEVSEKICFGLCQLSRTEEPVLWNDGVGKLSAYPQMIADNVPVLAVGTSYQHCALVVSLLRDSMHGARFAGLAGEGQLIGWRLSQTFQVWIEGFSSRSL